MSRLKIKLEKNRTIKSPVIDVTSDYKKIIICKTTKEFLVRKEMKYLDTILTKRDQIKERK